MRRVYKNLCPATVSASIMAANMWKNNLKNVESDNNNTLQETLLDCFLQRNGTYCLSNPRNIALKSKDNWECCSVLTAGTNSTNVAIFRAPCGESVAPPCRLHRRTVLFYISVELIHVNAIEAMPSLPCRNLMKGVLLQKWCTSLILLQEITEAQKSEFSFVLSVCIRQLQCDAEN